MIYFINWVVLNGIIRQSEFFVYSKKDQDAVYECLERDYRFPEVTTWIRANKKDFELVKSIGVKETGILVSCSDYHIFYKMNMKRSEIIEHYLDIIRQCIEVGIRPRCHFEDITRADFYGFVVPFASALMKLSDGTGMPIKIRACDTMGYGVTFPWGQFFLVLWLVLYTVCTTMQAFHRNYWSGMDITISIGQ